MYTPFINAIELSWLNIFRMRFLQHYSAIKSSTTLLCYRTHTSRSPPSIRLLTRDRMLPDSALRLIPAHMKQSTTLIAAQYRAHPVEKNI